MYGKLFTSLYQGTLRGKPDEILVFTNLIAHADQHGCVDIHYQAISDEVGLPVERVKTAISNLESPDPESRSPEEDGKRLIPLDEHRAWGWHIVNYAKYRSIRNEDDRREQNRLAQQKWREKQKISKVSRVSQDKPMQKQKHIQIQKKEEEKSLSANADVADVFSYWQSVFSKPKHTLTKEREKVLKARLKKYSVEDIMRAIDGCKKSPHHRGINKTGTVYDELTLICRSDTDLERFIGYNEQEFINGNGKQNSYISERAERAVTKHNIIETVRARVAEQDRTVSGQDAPDRT